MSTITKQWLKQKIADMEAARDEIPFGLDEDDSNTLAAMKLALASLELERGMIRRFDLDMSDCDSCGQDCGADMVEDLDGEYVLWDEVLPHLYRYDEYAAQPAPVSVPDLKELEAVLNLILMLPCPTPKATYFAKKLAVVIDTCRAAMLQGADGSSPDGWVACSERMPDETQPVITVSEGGVVQRTVYQFCEGVWSDWYDLYDDVSADSFTHWMPLPAAPQQESKP